MADELDARPQGQREITLAELACMSRPGIPARHIGAWAWLAGAIITKHLRRPRQHYPPLTVIDLPRLRAWLHEHGTKAWLAGGILTLTAKSGVTWHVPLGVSEARARLDQACKHELRLRGLS